MKKAEIINMLADALPRPALAALHNRAALFAAEKIADGYSEKKAYKEALKAYYDAIVHLACERLPKAPSGRPRK